MAATRDALWQSGHDESVEVNQRALIDKVLARYSGEFTVFRELLQNSDDAASKAVEIHFETKSFIDNKNKPTADQAIENENSIDILSRLKTELIHQWAFKNNGLIFREEDWNRLKKIAEGNPDEEKIGAFGVGFYSLFSITEEPFVTSGDQWMGFYWKDKKDQLYARRGHLPPSPDDPTRAWTTFEMPLREPAPMPIAFDFVRFLASSITFVTHLREVSVFVDGRRLARLVKDPGAPTPTTIPTGLKTTSPQGTMRVVGVKTTSLLIQAEVMRCVYASFTAKSSQAVSTSRTTSKSSAVPSSQSASGFLSSLFSSFAAPTPQRVLTPQPPPVPKKDLDLHVVTTSHVILTIFSADIEVRLDRKLAAELQRSTKKNPPQRMNLSLIYTGKSEYDASVQEDEKLKTGAGSVFQGLRADLEGNGSARVFIGHATGQTTGLGGHMAARFIPTVERESIDLVDRNVSLWNKELLYIGGFVARVAYETELALIHKLWIGAAEGNASPHSPGDLGDEQLRDWLMGRCLHALKFFTFYPSTPSAVVSSLLEAGFYSSATNASFLLVSSMGVKSASEVRIPDPALSAFLKRLPVLPQEIADGAPGIIETLRSRGVIKNVILPDILNELRARPLDEQELTACMRWWVNVWTTAGREQNTTTTNLFEVRRQLIEAALLSSGIGTKEEKIIPLSSIKTFVNLRSMGNVFPLDGPFPEHTLPISVCRAFQQHPEDVLSAFDWDELSIPDWLKYVVAVSSTAHADPSFDISLSAPWSERVLGVIARMWPSLSEAKRREVVAMLADKTCVPTQNGMKLPAEAYFPDAKMFPDLPIVTFANGAMIKGALKTVLEAMGVRKHVDLQIVFNRMIKTGDWTIADLIKYLCSVQKTLAPVEIERLQKTSAFTKEQPSGSDPLQSQVKYTASQLYEPSDVFRALRLPIIDWGVHAKWRNSSEEAKFLYMLGLRRQPPLPDLLRLAADPDASIRSAALKYFLDNHTKYPEYDPAVFSNVAFVPVMIPDGDKELASPTSVFVEEESAVLGFLVVHPSIRDVAAEKLKLSRCPPTQQVIERLASAAPRDELLAREWFEALAGRFTDFSPAQLRQLSALPFVPVPALPGSSVKLQMITPKDCYFRRDNGTEMSFQSELFIFVDFGTKANSFLSACGTKHEPSVEEIVQMLLNDPKKFYRSTRSRENYIAQLRNVAVNIRLISSSLIAQMKRTSFLIGSKRVRKVKDSKAKRDSAAAVVDMDDDEWEYQYDLLRPDQIVIADDTNSYQYFGDAVYSSPQEDLLEDFYTSLGSPRLTALVREDPKPVSELNPSHPLPREIRALVLERLPLFLHEHTHARTKIQYSWLNNEKNFIVRAFTKLTVTRHLKFGAVRMSKDQDASATARRTGGGYGFGFGQGPIELWVAGNVQVDMYEVATSLCRMLFETPKNNDALLFMTILSTDLRSLRRRGYNVDRILKQQQAEREAAERQRQEHYLQQMEAEQLVSEMSPTASETTLTSPEVPPKHDGESPKEKEKRESKRVSAMTNNLWKRMRGGGAAPERAPAVTSVSRPTSPDGEIGGASGSTGNARRPVSPGPQITPMSNIEANIQQAIAACREERNDLVQNREQMRMVKESLDEGYCDVSGRVGDLSFVGSMGEMRVYVTKDVPDGAVILSARHHSIARFIHILRPLRDLYKLPKTSVHVFCDMQGPTIAFNRNGSIFCNLRFFEAWHDGEVEQGVLSKAYISWFYTIAHEIAHNLVQPHNSEHEFYFSSICEAHTVLLSKLILSSQSS